MAWHSNQKPTSERPSTPPVGTRARPTTPKPDYVPPSQQRKHGMSHEDRNGIYHMVVEMDREITSMKTTIITISEVASCAESRAARYFEQCQKANALIKRMIVEINHACDTVCFGCCDMCEVKKLIEEARQHVEPTDEHGTVQTDDGDFMPSKIAQDEKQG